MIEVRDLVKDYTVPAPPRRPAFAPPKVKKRALDSINFTVPKGQVLGLIGPNGAGKTTTVKVLTGILTPTAGHVRVLGFDPQRDRYRYTYHIGLVFGQRSLLWYDIPVIESLRLYADIYEIDRAAFDQRVRQFSEMLDIGGLLHIPVRKLSLGQRMRAEIAASLLHTPEVLFLDEPTIGLDSVAKERVREFLRQLNRDKGTTIVLTTHDMNDIEALAQRVLILDGGRIIYDGAVGPLKELDDHKVIDIQYLGGPAARKTLLAELQSAGGAVYDGPVDEAVTATSGRLTLKVPRAAAVEAVARLVALGGITDLNVQPPRLDSVIRNVYEKRLAVE